MLCAIVTTSSVDRFILSVILLFNLLFSAVAEKLSFDAAILVDL